MSDGLAGGILGRAEVAVFENLYVAYAVEARGLARAILVDDALAQDAVHSGFLEMLRYVVSGRRWHDPSAARAAVLRNVRWAALKIRRSRRRAGTELATPPGDDEAMWARAEARALCEQIVAELGQGQREVIDLRYTEGLSSIDAAARLGVTVDVFEARLRRALKAARRVAQSQGALRALGPLLLDLRDRRARLPRPAAALRSAAHLLALPAAGALVAMSAAVAAAPPGVAVPPDAGRPIQHAAATLELDPIDAALVLDAVAPTARVVVALGRGRACDCLELFRSGDAGATWTAAPLAASGSPMPVPPGSERARPCGTAAVARFCDGQRIEPAGPPAAGGPGLVLRLSAHRVVYFRRLAGVLCSADGGVSWRPRCSP